MEFLQEDFTEEQVPNSLELSGTRGRILLFPTWPQYDDLAKQTLTKGGALVIQGARSPSAFPEGQLPKTRGLPVPIAGIIRGGKRLKGQAPSLRVEPRW
jgi:hypothetical protein